MLRIIITALLICGILSVSYAQDSTRKTAPVKSGAKYKPASGQAYRYHTRHDSAALKLRAQDSVHLHPTFGPPPAIDKSLNGQYQYLLSRVYYHQQPLITALWKNATDTLNVNRRKLTADETKLSAQNKLIDSLNAKLNGNGGNDLSPQDSINMLGITLSKTTYALIMWGLVAALGVTVVVVIARSAAYRREAKYRIQLYSELEDEFKAYKTKANDKEIKLARELQTERNKLDELLGRG